MMARNYSLRSVDEVVKALWESETAKESAVDCVSDEGENLERMSGSESEEDAVDEEFKPPEETEYEHSDLKEVVPKKRQRQRSSITRGAGRSNRGRMPSIVRGVNGHRWYTTPRERSQQRRNLPTSYLPSPVGAAKQVATPFESWNLLFPDCLLQKIVRHTNEEIERYLETLEIEGTSNPTYSYISLIELKAYIGLLYFSGMQKTNNTNLEDLWNADYGSIRYRATMSQLRFSFISKCIRFDDKSTRLERKQIDKFVPIREIWEQFNI